MRIAIILQRNVAILNGSTQRNLIGDFPGNLQIEVGLNCCILVVSDGDAAGDASRSRESVKRFEGIEFVVFDRIQFACFIGNDLSLIINGITFGQEFRIIQIADGKRIGCGKAADCTNGSF